MSQVQIGSGEAHIWRFSLDQPARYSDSLRALLSAGERKRADSFRLDRDRARHCTAHAFLRMILGSYVHEDPRSLQFAHGPLGKPKLDSRHARPDIRFSISHSDGIAAVAVTIGHEIGVDIEQVRDLPNIEDMARKVFSPAERRAFSSLAADAKEKFFFRCWVRKEAVLKARGIGISDELDRFSVSRRDGRDNEVLIFHESRGRATRWFLQDIEATPGHEGACCTEGKRCEIRVLPFELT